MGFNKLDVTSTYEHEEPIILLTDKMLVKSGRKVQKKGATMIRINVIRNDIAEAEEAAENAKYNRLLVFEMGLIVAVVIAAVVLS